MKKIILNKTFLLLGLAVSTMLASCLKDKGFENGEYGAINSNIEGKEWVSIPSAGKAVNNISVNSTASPQELSLFVVSYDYKDPASQDITVNLSVDNSKVSAADPTLTPLPTNLVSIPSTVTIKAGQRVSDKVKVTFTNTTGLDPNKKYGVGFTITSVSKSGVQIPSNLKTVVYGISVRNKYDGKYRLDGKFYHPSQSPNYDAFTVNVELHTTGPNSVKLWVPEFDGYYGPGLFAGALNAFGAQEPEITIDPVTNKATVQNSYVGAVTFYTMAADYDSHYDPATKKIYVKYGYNYNPGPTFNPAANREWTYEFTYLGPR